MVERERQERNGYREGKERRKVKKGCRVKYKERGEQREKEEK